MMTAGNLTRRTITLSIAGLFAASSLPVVAQIAPQEGKQYRVIQPRISTKAGEKKIEVIEFFWYGCPHCNTLDPSLEAWLKKAPADVSFKRVHIHFGTASAPDKRTETHQRLFYVLETLGLNSAQNSAVFNAIHADRKTLNSREAILDWAKSRHLDMTKFTAAYDDGFTLSRKMREASALQEAYKVDGVPYFAVDGQYITSPSIAGGEPGFYTALDFLIAKVRKDRSPSASLANTNEKNQGKKSNDKINKKTE
jgi:thiol:disulfide interchange protein DsbA